ncbi:glycosyltransferase family 25 protein [Sedimentimonas flavescens]|uniref:Glycosyltransferase family 25 protein n=1 Tax=Sedimentimonas flavescens TaxID=2851012 RepID=A0ABT3A2R3_9RHOB|nr:glycosyltransferase family 25 protein [Sedimentimonas flavescens]MCV2880221.1 glycosyltransferase family 25 protein [Sedimentimonas flavescens]
MTPREETAAHSPRKVLLTIPTHKTSSHQACFQKYLKIKRSELIKLIAFGYDQHPRMHSKASYHRMPELEVFLINLDRSEERLKSATIELNRVGISFTRVTAVDGSLLNLNESSDYYEKGAKSWFGRPLTNGEVGCYLSHVKCLRLFLAGDKKYALILEDDIALSNNASDIWKETEKHLDNSKLQDWWLINLGKAPHKLFSKVVPLHSGNSNWICRSHYYSFGTHALLWSRSGAEAALKDCLPIISPVDVFFRDWNFRKDRCFALLEPPFTVSGAESEIEKANQASVSRKRRERFLSRQRRRLLGKSAMYKNIVKFHIRKFFDTK